MGSAILTAPVPRTAMPFTFLLPSSAPMPAPPLLPKEVMMVLMCTRFSPAGPMVATSNSGPFSLDRMALASKVPLPQMWLASSMVTFSSSILMYTGLSL